MISTTWPVLFVGLSTLTQSTPSVSPADTQSTAPASAISITICGNQNQTLSLSTPGTPLTGADGKQFTITTTPADPRAGDPATIDHMPNPYHGPADPNQMDRMAFYNGPADPNEIDHMAFGVTPKTQPSTPSITLPPGVQVLPLAPNAPATEPNKTPEDRSATPSK